MTEYRLVTCWRIAAPLQRLFDTVTDSLHWPDWWPGSQAVTEVEAGNDDGIDSVRRYCWKSRLPYRLCFDARTTRVVMCRELAASIDGDLRGHGRWLFTHDNGITAIRHEWHVCTTRRWMNFAAPLARPLFAANHHALMRHGAEGLARRVGGHLLDVSFRELSPGRRRPSRAAAVLLAAAVAGTAATAVQLALWWAAAEPVVALLRRDTRMAAAIVLGPGVLPPPLALDPPVLASAAAIHAALSVVYAAALAPFAVRRRPWQALALGGAFGLLLFGLNMWGFTGLFPWFVASRDWPTAAAHAVFGMSAAGVLSGAGTE